MIYLLISMSLCVRRCPWGSDPVCGKNGVTYRNKCSLMADYQQMEYEGMCRTDQGEKSCRQTYLPVCGKDGVTY